MIKGLALFDFDGTITTHDTLLEIIKYQKGKSLFYFGFLVLSPVMILYKLKLISNWRAKEIMLAFFFGGDQSAEFQRKCDAFISERLPALLRKEALQKIALHLSNHDRVIVISASSYNWIEGWCKSMNIELIATRLEEKQDRITGKLSSLNCYGKEKENRIKDYLDLQEFSPIYAYGDTVGDKEMLELAHHAFYRKF